MFTRTLHQQDIPDREDMPLEEQLCPPHEFEAAWGTPPDAANHEDTVPALYCRACGDIRRFRVPE
jgi:hypothetical protein